MDFIDDHSDPVPGLCVGGGAMVSLALAERRISTRRGSTGCRIEQRYVQSVEALWNLLAVLTPIALRRPLIRQAAQQATEMLATDVVSQEIVRVVIHLDIRHREIVTAKHLWHAIALMARLSRPYL